MTEKPQKQRRRRGVILTPTGLEKLLTAKQEEEYCYNHGHRFTLEVLSEKTLLGVDTLMKVFACESGVDKQTLKQCFQAFNLTLEVTDYRRPNLPETNSVNPNSFNELPEGRVPLNSPFYIERNQIEQTCYQNITQAGSLIRIKAPQRMGKTSLTARILHYAQQQKYHRVYLSFQLATAPIFKDLNHFLLWICASITRELGLENHLQQHWDELLGCKINCKIYLEKFILSQIDHPLVIAFDDIEYLFPYPQLVDEFFSILRLWHEEGKNNSLWQKLRLIVAYSHSQEVYQPLDTHRCLFSVGLPIELPNFTIAQVRELSQRYGLDKNFDAEKLHAFLAGNPYLVRLALYPIARGDCTLETILSTSVRDESNIFKDHLQRLLWHLQYLNGNLATIFAKVVMAEKAIKIDLISAFQLQSLGLIHLQGNFSCVSCPLYRQYFCEYFGQSSVFSPNKPTILGKKITLTHFNIPPKNHYAM
jgi:AAA-like domain